MEVMCNHHYSAGSVETLCPVPSSPKIMLSTFISRVIFQGLMMDMKLLGLHHQVVRL